MSTGSWRLSVAVLTCGMVFPSVFEVCSHRKWRGQTPPGLYGSIELTNDMTQVVNLIMHNLFFKLEFCNAGDRISPTSSVIYSLNMLAPAHVLLKQTCRVRSV